MHRIASIGMFVLLSSSTYGSTTDSTAYTLDYVGPEYGLPQAGIRAVAQDLSGFLWVGTESGLHRFDGLRFDMFEPPFGHGVVNSIDVDSRGRIWASWLSSGTTILDPLTRQWTTLDLKPPRATPLGFLEDPSGKIWLSDGSALYEYDETSEKPVVMAAISESPGNIGTRDLVWSDGIIWLSDDDGALGYEADSGKILGSSLHGVGPAVALLQSGGTLWSCHRHRVYKREHGSPFELVYENQDVVVSSCASDGSGNFWIATSNEGALVLSGSKRIREYQEDDSDPASIPSNNILSLFPDKSGRVWLVTSNHVSLHEDGKFHNYTHSSRDAEFNTVSSHQPKLIEDRSGVMWIGTALDGIARLSQFSRKFQSAAPPGHDTGLTTPVMDRFGDLWVGSRGNGVYRRSRNSESWRKYTADFDDPTRLPTGTVRALIMTTTDELYAGSETGLLNRYESDTDNWTRINIGGNDPIHSLLELPDHRIAIARGHLVSVYDPENGTSNDFRLGNDSRVTVMGHSKRGFIWIGTRGGNGLLEFDPDKGVLRDWSEILGSISAISLFEDELGMVWIGTWGSGLVRFDPLSRTVARYDEYSELPNHTISGILPGAQNDLWASSESGLIRIRNCLSQAEPCEPVVKQYDVSDGLANRWYAAQSHSVSPTGELLFGGPSAIDYFHPGLFEENRTPPKIDLVALRVNGEDVTAENSLKGRIELPDQFGELEIHFAATDFHDPEKNTYEYRLGKTSQWIALGSANRMTLRNLQAGTRELQISGSNNDGIWSENPVALTISVAYPAYLSGWAILAYAALLLALLYIAERIRQRRIRAYTVRLEHQIKERTVDLRNANRALSEFYANVSHEVRTPLALIFSAVDRLTRATSSDNVERIVDSIGRHIQSLNRYVDGLISVSQMQSSSEPQWGWSNASEFLNQLVDDFEPLARNRGLTIEVRVAGEILVKTQPNALDTIFSNLVVNAIKHAEEDGVILVSAEQDNRFAKFTIEDDGPGVAQEIREKIFDRGALYSAASGYGIGLHLVRQTIVALGGNVAAEESKLGGACFAVWIPLAEEGLPKIESVPPRRQLVASTLEPGVSNRHPVSNGDSSLILIVEDNRELREGMCEYLAENHSVLATATVKEALGLAVAEVPDAIVCDVMLPDGSGFDLIEELKTNVVTDHIPIVVATALADEQSRRQGLQHRADAYLTKPFRRQTLELTLQNLILDRQNVLRHAALSIWNENWNSQLEIDGLEDSFARRLLSTLEEHYPSADTDVGTIATSLAMSRRALERKTHQALGRSPYELLTEFRLKRAASLLENGTRVSEAAYACGFRSPTRFGAVFKKRLGYTPREHAKRKSTKERS